MEKCEGEKERERDSSALHLKALPRKSSCSPEPDTPHRQQRGWREKASFGMSGGDPHPPLGGVLMSGLSLSRTETNVSKKERFSVFYHVIWILICVPKAPNKDTF